MKIDKIKQQEQLPSIRKVQELLHFVKPPQKSQPEWVAIEDDLFSILDKPGKKQKEFFLPGFEFLLRPYALIPAVSAALLLIVLSVGRFTRESDMLPLKVVTINGKVDIFTHKNSAHDTLAGNKQSGRTVQISKGCSFSTQTNSAFKFQIGKDCAFELSPNSNLTIKKCNATQMVFQLSQGTILAKVHKRTKEQKFEVITPTAVCKVTGTIFKVDVVAAENDSAVKTMLTVYEGNVLLVPTHSTDKRPVSVSAGQQCSQAIVGPATLRGVPESETPIKSISTLELLVNEKYLTVQATGLVDVSSQPEEALIIIDDTIVGKTPLVLRKSIGCHKIKLFTQGYTPWEQSFFVGKDSISSVATSLVAIKNIEKGTNDNCARKVKSRASSMIKADPESLLVAIPDYVEAMVQFTIGEYQKALGVLDSLKDRYPLDMKSRMTIMKKINDCYAKIGDFTSALASLQDKLDATSPASGPGEKEQLLWEIANLNANCMGDYDEAELALIELLSTNPAGNRSREASEKLAEVRYMRDNYDGAAATYKAIVRKFPDNATLERSLFSLASILKDNLHHYKEAAGVFTKVINNFPRGNYYKAALFARGECFDRLGHVREAQGDYKQCLALDPHGIWNAACAQRLRVSR
jgi:tetratricopeptide (TPR) repeat protein